MDQPGPKKSFTSKARLQELEKKLETVKVSNNSVLQPDAKPFTPTGVVKLNEVKPKDEVKPNPEIKSKPKPKKTKAKTSTSDKPASSNTNEVTTNNNNTDPTKTVEAKPRRQRVPVARPKPKTDVTDLRSVEINQLRLRFQPTGFSQKTVDETVHLQCSMPIVDPDFPFDLPSVRLQIVLPEGYPGTAEAPIRPVFNVLNSDIPASITSKIDFNMKWGVNSLPGGVLVCRPMLKYLEEHLERWLVDSGRDIKFLSSSAIKVSASDKKPIPIVAEEDEKEAMGGTVSKDIAKNSVVSTARIQKGDWLIPAPVVDQTDVGGNSFTLACQFSACRGIDLLCSQRLSILVSCDRCRFNFPVEGLRPFVDRIEHCLKCTNMTKYYYKMQFITPGGDFEGDNEGFEGVLGAVRMVRAKPVDLLPSLLQSACSRCYGREDEFVAEVVDELNSFGKVDGVKIGEVISFNCFACHQRIRYGLERISWQSDEVGAKSLKPKQKSSTSSSNQPVLAVGTPLPLNGACAHYKKSFRWYRFPCCGMAFPCDECHDVDPIAKSHPVEWATRFICGFCSREQSISVKECPECGKDTSAAGRKKTAFWEGGKGTRNQIFMSRKDSKKYKDYSRSSNSAVKKREDK